MAQLEGSSSMTSRDALLLAHADAVAALEAPAVRFLARSKHTAFVVAVFRSAFGADGVQVPTHVMHERVEQAQSELSGEGVDVPVGSGREVCRGWLRDRWLRRIASGDDSDVYVKTAHAEAALTMIDRNSRARPQLSESSIATILHAAEQCAMDASDDARARVARLDQQIAVLVAERDRIAAGGAVEVASDRRMLERLGNLDRLLADLPADFLAAAEAVDEIHRELADAFRADDRAAAAVISDYLARLDALVEDNRAAAFVGASELFRDDAARLHLSEDIDTFLSHPFTRLAEPAALARARAAVFMLQAGLNQVLQRRRRASDTLRARIQQRTDHDTELRGLVDGIRSALIDIGRSGQRWQSPSGLLPTEVAVGHLPTRFHDPADHLPPPPLHDPDVDAEEDGLSFEELRRYGGPAYFELQQAAADRLAVQGTAAVAEVFADLDVDLRRPVDLLGLMQLAGTDAPSAEEPSRIMAVRPDGTEVVLVTADLLITDLEEPV